MADTNGDIYTLLYCGNGRLKQTAQLRYDCIKELKLISPPITSALPGAHNLLALHNVT